GSESLLAQRLVQPGLPDAELTPDFLAAIGCRQRRRTLRAIDQRLGEPRRHQEAHQLAADMLGYVDADDLAVGGNDRAAAHARIDGSRKVDPLVIAALDQPVVG